MLRSSASRTSALIALAAVVLALGGWRYRITRPGFRLARGQQAARIGDFDKAEQFAMLLEEAGDKDRCRLLRGEMQYLQKDPLRALATLSGIKEAGALRVDAAYLSARCLIALSKVPGEQWRLHEAERALKFVGDQRRDHVDARRELAAIYYDQGDFRRALTLLEQVRDLDPNDARSVRLMGLMFKDMDQPTEAVPAYRESLRRDPNPPDLPDIRVELGECLLKLHKDDEVLELLRNDNSPPAVCIRVESMIANGQVEEATELLDKTLRQGQGSLGGVRRLRAEQYQKKGDPVAAAKLLELVVDEYAHDFRSQYQLARCYNEIAQVLHGRYTFVENIFLKRAAQHSETERATKELLDQMHNLQTEAMDDPWNAKIRYRLADLADKLERPELGKMWRTAAEACREPRQ